MRDDQKRRRKNNTRAELIAYICGGAKLGEMFLNFYI